MYRYDENILNILMDKYENSLLYTGENQRHQTISLSVTKKTLPEYFDESSRVYETIHAQLTEMEQKGFLKLVWKNKKVGHILEKCVLCTDKADEIYLYLCRRPKTEKENEILRICGEYKGLHPVTDNFLVWVEGRLLEKKSVKQYLDPDRPEEFRGRLNLLYAILTNSDEVFFREFSVRFWKDSKIAEKELQAAAGIIARFSEDEGLKELEAEQLLEEFGICKNPSWVMMKGCGRFCIVNIESGANGISPVLSDIGLQNASVYERYGEKDCSAEQKWLSLNDFPGGIGISSADIQNVIWDKMHLPQSVVTIENLTSFHRFFRPDTLILYLGGYHNKVKRLFLKNLYESCKNAGVTFEHFGDIDCGGFKIWKDLRENTGIPFQTLKMDEETYLSHLEFGKKLTAGDRERLKSMAEDPYFAEQRELFGLMLEKGIKIEQECVRIS
ncbi:MAG: DUF2220 domain-containing protein [Lachnospiraceae bacterium]|nr:DUF2220 domain-containing protein [Lachnospiraceae bacterium]